MALLHHMWLKLGSTRQYSRAMRTCRAKLTQLSFSWYALKVCLQQWLTAISGRDSQSTWSEIFLNVVNNLSWEAYSSPGAVVHCDAINALKGQNNLTLTFDDGSTKRKAIGLFFSYYYTLQDCLFHWGRWSRQNFTRRIYHQCFGPSKHQPFLSADV